MMDLHIDGRMQFNPGDFVTEKFMFDGDVVNVVVVYFAEHAAHMPDDPVLPAIIDNVVADDMRSNLFLAPTDLQRAENRFHLILIAGLLMPSRAEIMPGGGLFANADGAAFGVMNDVVF